MVAFQVNQSKGEVLLISIIVPIYGVEKYIRKCVESILSQSYTELEIILVDDGSKDECPRICDEYAQKDSRIKVIHKENGGLVNARQAGLAVAQGEYVGFVDGDDWIETDMYLEIAKVLEKHSPDMVVTEFYCDYDDRKETSNQILDSQFYTKERLKAEVYPKMLFNGVFYHFGINPNCWSKVFKKELLKKHLMQVDIRTKMGEDAAFTYPCLLDSTSVCYVSKPLYHYRIVTSSMSRSYDSDLENIIMLPYQRLKEANKNSEFDISEQLSYYLVYLTNFLIRNEAKALNIKSGKQIRNVLKSITKNEDVHKASKTVKLSKLPVHTKIIVCMLRLKSVAGLKAYTKLFGKYLKKGK